MTEYTVTKDYSEQYNDGSGRWKTIFKAGQTIPWETARALGLVQGEEPKPAKAQKEETQVK